ncbi:MAG: hypothetical protein FWC24_02445 [Treponema sp.]|nr:hypothetical protein [Treponema sp.]
MKKIKTALFAALFIVLLTSCIIFPDLNMLKPVENLDILEENSFYAQNMTNKKYYKVKASILWEGSKCVIWAENDSMVTRKQAQDIANEYDSKIRPIIIETFSRDDGEMDIIDYANDLAGRNDRKLTVLLLDIKDGFKNEKTDTYVAGYFFSGNFLKKGNTGSGHYSNGRDMIYIDTDPGLSLQIRESYVTFAHELQHLVNFVTSVRMNRGSVDTWIDEGLSSQAEHFYLGDNSKDKCEWFSADSEGTIARGNNFFVWGNHEEKPRSILDDYATVYLFFRWLYLQADSELQSHIFYDIGSSSYRNYRAVTAIAGAINPAWGNWENLLRTWLAANYYPHNAYGYTGDAYLQEKIRVSPATGITISLYPGEGAYSVMSNSYSPAETGNHIRYAGLADNAPDIITSPPYRGNILLTFNANTNNAVSTRPETGSLTGISPSVSRKAGGNGKTSGPYKIDARDILGRTSQ